MKKFLKFLATAGSGDVSAILDTEKSSKSIYVFAHGAGANMEHSFMEELSARLVSKNVGVLRFNFPFMEGGKGRPDPPKRAMLTIKNAIEKAKAEVSDLPIFVGGKSFGGRMASKLLSEESLDIAGLIYVGFPLHAPGRPGTERAAHLKDISHPMLFLQGTRDTLATPDLIREVTSDLSTAETIFYEGADHSFKTLKKMKISAEEMMDRLSTDISDWIGKII